MSLSWSGLVDDAWNTAFGYLDVESLLQSQVVSSQWRRLIVGNHCLWKELYESSWRGGKPLPPPTRVVRLETIKDMIRERHLLWRKPKTYRLMDIDQEANTTVLVNGLQSVTNQPRTESVWNQIRTYRARPALRPLFVSPTGPVSYFELRVWGGASVGIESAESEELSILRTVFRRNQVHLGWINTSYGFHSDDGSFYWSEIEGGRWSEDVLDYSQPWTGVHDAYDDACVVGCGFHHVDNALFFTKNGKYLGKAPRNIHPRDDYLAAFALDERGNTAQVNFGSSAFEFDIEAHCAQDEPWL